MHLHPTNNLIHMQKYVINAHRRVHTHTLHTTMNVRTYVLYIMHIHTCIINTHTHVYMHIHKATT